MTELQDAMTVGELIKLLQSYPSDLPVLMPKGNGDYWGRVALTSPSRHRTEDLEVQYSEYHQAMIVTPDGEEAEERVSPDERLDALILA